MSSQPTPGNGLFGAVTLTKNADADKYKYFRYGIGFDRKGFFFTSQWQNWQKCNILWSRYEFLLKD